MRTSFSFVLVLAALAGPAVAQTPWEMGKKAAGNAAVGSLEKEINKRLLAESRKNQCSFKSDSDVLEKGCDPKAKKLANALVDAKKRLESAGVKNFRFEVSGHTDSSGSAEHNKQLSQKRAERMKKELSAKGVPEGDIVAVGMGSDRPLVTPDDTAKKKAKNRRYEVQVKL
jgi:outer membrane protein OmpA-like peptidoglycan-associated protein